MSVLLLSAASLYPVQGVLAQEERPVRNDAREVIDARDAVQEQREQPSPTRDNAALPQNEAAVQETAPDPVPVTDGNIRVGAVLIDGAGKFDQSVFARVIEPIIGSSATRQDLAKLTQQIAEIARDEGYVFASAYIPPQKLELGLLRITLDPGVIDEVQITGSYNTEVRALLNRLVGLQLTRDFIERQILLCNDIPEISVGKTSFVREDGKRILQVKVREVANYQRLSADNYGSDSFGPVRTRLDLQFRALIDDSDILYLTARTVPDSPQEILSLSANYALAVGTNGTRVGAAASMSDTEPGGRRAGSGIKGNSQYATIYASHPLKRSADASLWLNTEADYLSIEQNRDSILLQRDNQVTIAAGLSSNIKLLGGRLRSGGEVRQGLAILGTTRGDDPLASRSDGDGVFTLGQIYASWTGDLFGDTSLRLSASGQVSSRPLFSAQEISIGGAYSVRGYDFSERSGDNGAVGLVELRQDFDEDISFLKRMQIYAFFDGGYVDNLQAGFGSGALLSSGGGIRARAGIFDLALEAAVPINEDRFDSDDKSPKVNVQVGINF